MRTIAAVGGSAVFAVRRAARAPQLALLFAGALAGCTPFLPFIPTSQGHIDTRQVKAEPEKDIPAPVRVTPFVPPPKPAAPPQTYSVVVNEVPVKELLLALARDTKQNIDIHPTLTGLVSLNAINETLPAILERVSKQVNMRYRTEGNTIIVSPDTPYVKTYRVNYVNMTRDTTSSIGVSGELTVTGGGSGGSGGSGGGASGGAGGASSSGSNTVVRTTSKNDFWDQMRDNIRSILNSTRLQSMTADARAERLALVKQEQELRVKQLEAASRAGQAAPALATSLSGAPTGAPQQSPLLPDDVVVNAASGTITVNATDQQHQLVQRHIDSITSAMQRQVLIEATIVEVVLSNTYQAGIDWSRLQTSAGRGITFTQSLLSGFGAGLSQSGNNFFQIGYVNPMSSLGNISATVKLLQEFGATRVLSSPKLMALNNQTALLKVVDNVVYFEVSSSSSQATTGGVLQTISTTAKTVAVGIVMSVTPQINEDGRVLLTVRPTVTRLNPETPFVLDPNPVLLTPNRVPQIQVREMESVLQVGSAQTVILGGLMQDNVRRAREQIPGADFIGALGEIFRFRDETATKTELVVFLRPTVIANASLESDELKFFQRFLPQPETPPQPYREVGRRAMSLLMKALEKAAKDRDEARAETAEATPLADPTLPGGPAAPAGPSTIPPTPAPAAASFSPGPRSELSLEPMPTPTEPSVAPPPARPETPARPAAAPRTGRGAAASREQRAKAATVVQAAGAAKGGGAVAWLVARPLWIIGIIATLIGIAYGTYLYLQLFHPALFLKQPPIAPTTPPASPVGQAPSSVPGTGTGPAAVPGVAAGAVPGAAPAAPGTPGAPGAPLPSAAVVQAEAPDFAPPPPPPAPAPPRAPEKPVVEAPPPPPPAPRDTIKVSRGSAVTAVSPVLTDAYAALQADRRDDAQRTYEQLLRAEPRNIDALLGLAAIATNEGRSEEATRRYLQILELDPRNTLAQSGLIGLLGRADPLAAESRLKQLIAREPSAHLHFTLGNLYADQSHWAAAQHAYFQAHNLEPGNPDYAYNLAVGLEHVSQGKLALGFYRRAVELASATGRARFNVAQAQQRISKLASQVE